MIMENLLKITFNFDAITENFKSNQMMSSPDITFTFKSGNPNFYPFDEYSADFILSGSWTNTFKNER